MPARLTDDLDRLMPVEQISDRWWRVTCPWCLGEFVADWQWRAYRWRHDHRCYTDENLSS